MNSRYIKRFNYKLNPRLQNTNILIDEKKFVNDVDDFISYILSLLH